MAKKPKSLIEKPNSDNIPNSNEVSDSTSIFKTLFGEIPQQDSSFANLFSDNNPFRRKNEPGLSFGATKAVEDANGHSDSSQLRELKKRKQKGEKNEKLDFDDEVVEESKKLKRVELKENENGDFGGENEKKKKKKRKRDDVELEYEASRYGVKDEMEENNNIVLGEKRKKLDNSEHLMVSKEGFDDESKLLRTVFVGNLPLKIKKKVLLKEFAEFGEIESVRIRSVPIVDGKIPRKGAVIKKQFNENCNSVHAYIVFKTEESAQASMSHNMAVVGGNHIRVDSACPPRKKLKGYITPLYDNKRTAFVGNLPFDVKDEEIYQLLSGLKNFETSVEAVRVIRDPGSSLGKGIAYVLFKTVDAAKLIVKKRYLKLRDRELRLSPAKADATPSKRKNPSSEMTNNHSAKRFAVDSRTTPGSENRVKATTNLSYQGLRANKSGSEKKVQKRFTTPAKSVSKSQPATEKNSSSVHKKRPAVAARKEKAKQVASGSKVVGIKRKFGNRTTPESSAGGQKKKFRKFK